MPTPPIARDLGERIIASIEQALRDGHPPPGVSKGNGTRSALRVGLERVLGEVSTGAIQGRYKAAVRAAGRDVDWSGKAEAGPLEYPVFPDARIPTDVLLQRLSADFERRNAHEQARKWFTIKVKVPGPIGIAWMGDPHLSDNGCNIPLFLRHVDVIRDTEGMFAANIGDTENNWAGKLAHLYSQQDTSRATERQLTEWLFSEAGLRWIVLLLGNHDVWNGNGDALSRIARGGAPMSDWQAKFKLAFPNGREARIWAAHDFPGHSQWNPLHGPQKAAKFTGSADLYVCGHKHNWSLFNNEDEHRGDVYWLARARGYKHIDSYADKLGFASQAHGSSIVSIFDPDASGPGFLTCFADVEEAAEYLTWKRQRSGL